MFKKNKWRNNKKRKPKFIRKRKGKEIADRLHEKRINWIKSIDRKKVFNYNIKNEKFIYKRYKK